MEMENTEIKEAMAEKSKFHFSNALKDSVAIGIAVIFVFVLSYYFDVFKFIVVLFQKNPVAVEWIDEIITGLLTLSIGLAIFAWRRLNECQQESQKCIDAEKELASIAITRAEAESIVSKQLHAEIEVLLKYLKEERDTLISKIQKNQ